MTLRVRVLIDRRTRLETGAIAPDVETATGDLTWRNVLLGRLEISPEVEEIDKETFDRLCKENFTKNKISLRAAKRRLDEKNENDSQPLKRILGVA